MTQRPSPASLERPNVEERTDTTRQDAIDRSPNVGVDRSQVISAGLRWSASWSLRMVIIAAGIWVAFKVIGIFWSALLPVILALILSTVLWPPARWLRSKGFPPALAAASTMIGMFVVLGGVFTLIGTTVSSQWGDLTDKAVAGVHDLQSRLSEAPFNLSSTQLNSAVKQLTGKLQTSGDKIANGVLSGATIATQVLVSLLVAIVLTFFFIKDGPRFLPFVRRIAGRGAGSHMTEALSRAYSTLGGFIRAQAIVSAIDSICIGIGLWVLQVPLALPLVVLTFFGGFIPIVGAFVAGAIAVLVALVTVGLTKALILLGVIVLVQQLEGHILSPIFQSRSMELHPGVVLLSVAFGGDEFGITGAFLAVPVAATVTVIFRYMNEQIDLRTGDVHADQLEPITPEGVMAAEAGEKHGIVMAKRWRSGRPDAQEESTGRVGALLGRVRRSKPDASRGTVDPDVADTLKDD
ncbi:AI-2E family transporter [Allobranchiibius sp. GilTou38]|uniref:AI-2E family transporter n=1 Tax=Allobranchiibius sp. GilTou38 TaxID=2815210 RepID=UPI001AA17BCC|nr:AI-2E family transporter [Allobranchiibius sp. GilTou38]MBO1765917.1 AI-2E family transporter [Allobranchiibius sp. GilTou38]